MSVDLYRPCPCGTGKKIKFCCRDLAADLDKIEKMHEGKQRIACLEHIEKLLKRHPDRAALLALQLQVLEELGEMDRAKEVLEHFLQVAPTNPVALAEKALMAAEEAETAVVAIEHLQKALENVQEEFPARLVRMLGGVSQMLFAEGEILAARGHLALYSGLQPDDKMAPQILEELMRSRSVPLILKELRGFRTGPEDGPCSDGFREANAFAQQGCWSAAAKRLVRLAQEFPDEPDLAYNLVTLFGYLGDTEKMIFALRQLVRLSDQISLDDAIEAEALAQMFDPKVRDATVDIQQLTYEVNELDGLMEKLLSNPACESVPVGPEMHTEDEPPPKAVFMLLDRPALGSLGDDQGEKLEVDDIPNVITSLFVYGRQTDREARVELALPDNEQLERGRSHVESVLGEHFQGDVEMEVVDKQVAVELELSWQWRLPPDLPSETYLRLAGVQRRQVMLEKWPSLPLPIFDGKTPREAAEDPALRIPLLAAVLILELSGKQGKWDFPFNELRQSLGLEVPADIDPTGLDVDLLPLVRLSRLVVDKLTDEQLERAYFRAAVCGEPYALHALSHELISRPDMHQEYAVDEIYGQLARSASSSGEATEYLHRAQEAAVEAGRSPASWLLAELSVSIQSRDGERVEEIMNRIQRKYINEPGVAEALFRVLQRFGLISPDGQVVGMPTGEPIPAAAAPEAASAGVWTPDGPPPAAPSAAKEPPAEESTSKIWLPGSD